MEHLIVTCMMAFLVLGAADKALFKNRLGLGEEFVKGLDSMGPLVLGMAGIMCAAPVLGKYLMVLAAPLFRLFGADPAMAAGIFLAVDMGGFSLTQAMTDDPEVILLGGVLLSSMLGTTLVFIIPVMMTVCDPNDHAVLAKGSVVGIVSIPFGLLAGAVAAGLSPVFVLRNAAPAFLLALLLSAALILFQAKTLAAFRIFGYGVQILGTVSLVLAALTECLGLVIVPGMAPLGEQLETIGVIGITLAGAYPLLAVMNRVLAPGFGALGRILGVSSDGITGMIASLANPFPFFERVKEMNGRGKIVGMAFTVPAAAMLGDHLGFLGVAYPQGILPMLTARAVSAAVAVILAEAMEAAPGRRRASVLTGKKRVDG